MNKTILFCIALLACVGLAAATDINNCTGSINSPEVYSLNQSITANASVCFDVNSSNVWIDCNGHSITGHGYAGNINIFAIRSGFSNVSINNCSMIQAQYGITGLKNSSVTATNNYIEDMEHVGFESLGCNFTLENNTLNSPYIGIALYNSTNILTNNLIIDNSSWDANHLVTGISAQNCTVTSSNNTVQNQFEPVYLSGFYAAFELLNKNTTWTSTNDHFKNNTNDFKVGGSSNFNYSFTFTNASIDLTIGHLVTPMYFSGSASSDNTSFIISDLSPFTLGNYRTDFLNYVMEGQVLNLSKYVDGGDLFDYLEFSYPSWAVTNYSLVTNNGTHILLANDTPASGVLSLSNLNASLYGLARNGYCNNSYFSNNLTIINSTTTCDNEYVFLEGNTTVGGAGSLEIPVTQFTGASNAVYDLRGNSTSIASAIPEINSSVTNFTNNWTSKAGQEFRIAMNEPQNKVEVFINNTNFNNSIYALMNSNTNNPEIIIGYASMLNSDIFIGCWNSSKGGIEGIASGTSIGTITCGNVTGFDLDFDRNITLYWNMTNYSTGGQMQLVLETSGSWKDQPWISTDITSYQEYTNFKNASILPAPNAVLNSDNSTLVILGRGDQAFWSEARVNFTNSKIVFVNSTEDNPAWFYFGSGSNTSIDNSRIYGATNQDFLFFNVYNNVASFKFNNSFVDNLGNVSWSTGIYLGYQHSTNTVLLDNITWGSHFSNVGFSQYCASVGDFDVIQNSNCTALVDDGMGGYKTLFFGVQGDYAGLFNNQINGLFFSNTNNVLAYNNYVGNALQNGRIILNTFNTAPHSTILLNNYLYNTWIEDTAPNNGSNEFWFSNSNGSIHWHTNNYSTSNQMINLSPSENIYLEFNNLGVNNFTYGDNFRNGKAFITFYGIPFNANIELLENGVPCGGSGCNIDHVYANGTIEATVQHFSNYSVNGTILSCGDHLNTSTTLYTDFNCSGTAFILNASNIVFDGNGHKITGDDTGYGIDATNTENTTIKNTELYNFSDGIQLLNSNNTKVDNNSIHSGNSVGIVVFGNSNNNTLQNNIVYDYAVTSCIYLQDGLLNQVLDNTLYNCNAGLVVGNSANDSIASNNTIYQAVTGISVLQNNDNYFAFNHVYNTSSGFDNQNGAHVTLASNYFDNPTGNYTDYLNFSLTDVTATGEYVVTWTFIPAALPTGYTSLAQKFLNISTASGTPVIDSAIFSWTDNESIGLTESNFKLFQYNGTWSDANASLDTAANTLTLTNFTPHSIYAIVVYTAPIPTPVSGSSGGTPLMFAATPTPTPSSQAITTQEEIPLWIMVLVVLIIAAVILFMAKRKGG